MSTTPMPNDRADRVDAMVADFTPAQFIDWMVRYHGLVDSQHTRQVVESNLRQQFRWHRLRGRLDRHPWLAALVELWLQLREADRRERIVIVSQAPPDPRPLDTIG